VHTEDRTDRQTDRPGPELGRESERAEEEEHEQHAAVLEVVEVRRVDRAGRGAGAGLHARTRNDDGSAACRAADDHTRHSPTARNSVPGSTCPLNDPISSRGWIRVDFFLRARGLGGDEDEDDDAA
jgi:hypothetical protein